ncbi:MAG: hypothetical protein DI556_20705 [Rhodovulum sulfidophilum]|uniref:Uncharacterized protein n=1 Tax=Rhodovulum sulfidophilum TaxID=35806 RepID=A0A2W5N0Y0_RHOSU|nr:MAG: hypothetical protein DI556_20705 [Rhodovulum sulfidophilum]
MARAIIKVPGSYGALRASLEIPMPEAEPAPPPSEPAPRATAEAKPRRAARAEGGARAEAGAAREITAPGSEAPAAATRKRVARANEYGIRVPYPAPGSNPAFDEVVRVYGEATAVKLIFKRAMDKLLEAGSDAFALAEEPTYETDGRQFTTTRALPEALLEAARRRIDPMALRPSGYLARWICVSAMGAELAALRR